MFDFLSIGSLIAGKQDVRKERAPPPLPTPVSFPVILPQPSPVSPAQWLEESCPQIFTSFAQIKRPSDIRAEHVNSFNVSREPVCEVESLLPVAPRGESFLPPKSWLQPIDDPHAQGPEYAQPSGRLLSSGRAAPVHRDFDLRLKEITVENVDGYAAISRMHPHDKKPARLAHFRKFWEHLDNMAYYWDTSLDEYLAPEEGSTTVSREARTGTDNTVDVSLSPPRNTIGVDDDEPRKRAKTHVEPSKASDVTRSSGGIPSPSLPTATLSVRQALPSDTPLDHQIPGTYRGHRISNGSSMPHAHLSDAVRYFVEPIAWVWGFSMTAHRRQPHLAIKSMTVPIRMSTACWRVVNDRLLARQGYLEGPVLGVCCRAETDFSSGAEGERDAILDLLRELGACLSLGQERAREGLVERKPGEGLWWVDKPRWGGGPGGEVGEARGDSDETVSKGETAGGGDSESKLTGTPAASAGAGLATMVVDTQGMEAVRQQQRDEKRSAPGAAQLKPMPKRKLTAAEAWKTLRPGSGYWDAKVRYQAIGKDPSDPHDEIFLISALNHHLRIIKLRVHRQYLACVTAGSPGPAAAASAAQPLDPDWATPTLQRTRWFDLFDVQDRMEAYRAVWGVMSYLARPMEEKTTEREKQVW